MGLGLLYFFSRIASPDHYFLFYQHWLGMERETHTEKRLNGMYGHDRVSFFFFPFSFCSLFTPKAYYYYCCLTATTITISVFDERGVLHITYIYIHINNLAGFLFFHLHSHLYSFPYSCFLLLSLLVDKGPYCLEESHVMALYLLATLQVFFFFFFKLFLHLQVSTVYGGGGTRSLSFTSLFLTKSSIVILK